MTESHANCLDLLYAFLAGVSATALGLIGALTFLGGFSCR